MRERGRWIYGLRNCRLRRKRMWKWMRRRGMWREFVNDHEAGAALRHVHIMAAAMFVRQTSPPVRRVFATMP